MVKQVADLVIAGAKAIAVFESPHTVELRTGVPLSGDSGEVVSKGLGFEPTVPMGTIIKNGKALLSVVNSFEVALQLNDCLAPLNEHIKSLNFQRLGAYKFKAEIIQIIREFDQLQSYKKSYIQRMNKAFHSVNDKPRVVVCGFIAQAFFEYAYELSNINFGSVCNKAINGVQVEILYVEHPSPKNKSNYWELGTIQNAVLKNFLSIA